jgi:hypothetical protein
VVLYIDFEDTLRKPLFKEQNAKVIIVFPWRGEKAVECFKQLKHVRKHCHCQRDFESDSKSCYKNNTFVR